MRHSGIKALLPAPGLIGLLGLIAAALIALRIAGLAPESIMRAAVLAGALLLLVLGIDALRSLRAWTRAPLQLERRLPHAFAVGAPGTVDIVLTNRGSSRCRGRYFELGDPSLRIPSMPLAFRIEPGTRARFEVPVTATARGLKAFEGGQIRLRSGLGLLDLDLLVGPRETRRVFPDFRRTAFLAWVAGERRLAELGIKAQRRRGSGTDFDQLAEYGIGDPVRHIDWKATLKTSRPIVRRFRAERDQSVIFLLDCGRRMRADDTQLGVGATHFDQALDALMLLAFIALGEGDSVGAMTFGTPPGGERRFAPRKGRATINALMSALGDVEPTATFSDYARAAADLLGRQRKRGLVVMITNVYDEDVGELSRAVALLRARHRVVLASLREQIVGELEAQPLVSPDVALEVAAAIEYRQRRARALRPLRSEGVLLIDCEPRSLGIELVRHYMLLKRQGAL